MLLIKKKIMKNLTFIFVAAATLTSCSTVSSVLQNNLPFNSNFVVTQGSPAQTQLSAVGTGASLNQIVGVSNNVKEIRPSTATVSVTSGAQGMGVFKSVHVYLTSGQKEILIASRDQIADNIGTSLSLDVRSQIVDDVMKSGSSIQQRVVYVLKSAPTTDLNVKSSITFTSLPIQ